MTPLIFLLAALAAGLGAAVRYLVDLGIARLAGTRFPWGVFVINLTGSFALGLVLGWMPDAALIVGTGFLGGYTTFSTAMVDTLALWRKGEFSASLFNTLGMLVLGLAAAFLGLAVGITL